jgi:hypothetical protein
MGRGSENLPLVRASRPSAADACRASDAALGGLHGRSIVVRERKGSTLGVPLAPIAAAIGVLWRGADPARLLIGAAAHHAAIVMRA